MQFCFFMIILFLTFSQISPESIEPLCESDVSSTSPSSHSISSYCECETKATIAGTTAIIKCDFLSEQDVTLTEKILGKYNSSLRSAYVRVKNARSVIITSRFMSEWLQALSSALDVWHSGSLYLQSSLPLQNVDKFSIYKTFVGVGIINCRIDVVPAYFLRDRTRGALRIKGSRIKRLEPGIIHNVKMIRYLAFQDTWIGSVEGPLDTAGQMVLSKRSMHSWDGLTILNVTMDFIAPASFNVTHHTDEEQVVVQESRFGRIGKGGFTVTGNTSVTIEGNDFSRLEDGAIRIAVTKAIRISKNEVHSWAPSALAGVTCHNNTRIQDNTMHVPASDYGSVNSTSPFHKSCGAPLVIYKISKAAAITYTSSSSWTTWLPSILGATCLMAILVAVAWYFKSSILQVRYRRDGSLLNRDETENTTPQEEEREQQSVEPLTRVLSTSETFYNPSFSSMAPHLEL